jgi:hypothetical protein
MLRSRTNQSKSGLVWVSSLQDFIKLILVLITRCQITIRFNQLIIQKSKKHHWIDKDHCWFKKIKENDQNLEIILISKYFLKLITNAKKMGSL